MKDFLEWVKDFRLAIFLMSLLLYLKISSWWRVRNNKKESRHLHKTQSSEGLMAWKGLSIIFILMGTYIAPLFGIAEQSGVTLMLIPMGGYLFSLVDIKRREKKNVFKA